MTACSAEALLFTNSSQTDPDLKQSSRRQPAHQHVIGSAFWSSPITSTPWQRPSGSARSSQTSQCSRSPSAETRAQIYQGRKDFKKHKQIKKNWHAFSGRGSVPLVESGGTLFEEHRHCTVEGAAVLALHRVHVARFHHVHRRGHQRCAETSGESGSEVAGHVVCGKQAAVISGEKKTGSNLKSSWGEGGYLRRWSVYSHLSLACAPGWALWWCHR